MSKDIDNIVDTKYKKLTESIIKWQIQNWVNPDNIKDYHIEKIVTEWQITLQLYKKPYSIMQKPISELTLKF